MRRSPTLFAAAALLLGGGTAAALAQEPAGPGGASPSTATTSTATGGAAVTSTSGTASTASAPTATAARATASAAVNLRSSPGGHIVGRLHRASAASVSCHRNGPAYSSPTGASDIWDQLARPHGRTAWTADGYLSTGTDALVAPLCGAPSFPPPIQPGQTTGQCGIVAPVTVLPPFADVQSFITASVPGARDSEATYHVPAAVTLAQGILETGAGRFTAGGNNFFGIKAQAAGPYTWSFGVHAVGCVLKKTEEVYSGRYVRTIAAFRSYESLDDSILDHGQLLATNPVYAPAFSHTDDPDTFAKLIGRYYATDPSYASKLIALMRKYALTQYDG